jgi:pSer/pThr/pTyr-binding forkhead associated (FHA) protein
LIRHGSRLKQKQMSQKENVAATWDDMDWGQFETAAGPASAVVKPSKPAIVEVTPAQHAPPAVPAVAASPAPAAAPVMDAALEQERLRLELERVKMEAEMARMKAEMLEQQRQLAAHQAKVVELPRTTPLQQDPSAVYPPPPAAAANALVFNPQSLATLTLEVEGGQQAVVTVRDPFTIGRNKSNDLVIRDLHVSSQHAKLVARKDGVFEVVDLGSSGGTFVNDERIERCALKNGDRIDFATVQATFRYIAGDQLDEADDLGGTLVQSKADVARKLAAMAKSPRHGLLTVLTDDEKSRDVPAGGQISIGRVAGNDLIIAEEHVSGRHARLSGTGGGTFELFDLGSSCGTFVNGVKIQHVVLNSGDRIRFGIVECVFIIIDPNGAPDNSPKPPPLRGMASLPKVEESGIEPLPMPKPAGRTGGHLPLVKRAGY